MILRSMDLSRYPIPSFSFLCKQPPPLSIRIKVSAHSPVCCRYVESPLCDANLAKYNAKITLTQRLTRFYTEIPSAVSPQNLPR